MGLSDVIGNFKFRRVKLGGRRNYQLTALGRSKIEKTEGEGPNWNVLSYMDENPPSCTVREIAEGAHLGEDRVRIIIERLMASGYVSRVSGE